MLACAGGRGLVEAGEAGDEPVQGGQGQEMHNRTVGGRDQPQLAALAPGPAGALCPAP
jgi:hypothetical protein